MTVRDSGSLFLEVAVRPAAAGVGIEVDVYDGASLGTMLATLEGAYEASIQSVMNDTGSGSFKIGRNDPKFNYIVQDNLVKVRVDGVYQFAGFMDNLSEVVASPNGAGAEIDTVGLRGVLAYLERGVVYPTSWPTASDPKVSYASQTKAAILIDLLTKAQARGALLSMSWDFTATNDSRGFPWVDSSDLDFAMGTDLLSVAKSLSATGDFDIAMSPSFVLHAYVSQGADTSSTVVFREGKHLGQADLTRQLNARPNKTRMLVQGGSAWVDGGGRTQYAVEVNDAADEATLGRRESFLNYSKSSDPATLTNVGNASIAQLKKQGESLQLPVTHGPALDSLGNPTGDYEPYVDYIKGDVVALDVPGTFNAAKYRIVGMTLSQRPGGDFDVALDFNSVYLEYLLRIQQQLNGLTSGTGGGVSSSTVGSSLGGGVSVIGGGKVAINATDSADYLANKVAQGNGGVIVSVIGSGGTQELQIGANVVPIGTLAARPAASSANANTFYFATDVAGGTLYVSSGTAWSAVAPGVGSGGAYILASVLTTEGDMLYQHTGAPARLPVGAGGTVLHGGTDPAYSAVVEGDLSLSDVTTADVSTTKHGLAPKAPNTGTKFLRDDATWAAVPAGSSTLAADTDVSIASPADGDALLYRASDSKWHNGSMGQVGAPTVDESVTSTVVTTANTSADTTLHDRTITGAPAGTYLLIADCWIATANPGRVYLKASSGGGALAATDGGGNNRPTHTLTGVRELSDVYLHTGGDLRVQIVGRDESGGAITFGNSGDDRFGRHLTVAALGAKAQLFATNYRARMTQAAAQSVASATWTQNNLDTVAAGEDPSGLCSTGSHQITVSATGLYTLKGLSAFSTSSGRVIGAIALNGTRKWFGPQFPASAALGSTQSHIIEVDAWLNAGDVLTLWSYQDSGGNANVDTGSAVLEAVYQGSAANPMTGKGDAIGGGTNGALTRTPAATADGMALFSDSTQPSGQAFKAQAPTLGIMHHGSQTGMGTSWANGLLDTADDALGVTCDTTNHCITIVTAGFYLVRASAFLHSVNAFEVCININNGGSPGWDPTVHYSPQNLLDWNGASAFGHFYLNVGDRVQVAFRCVNTGETVDTRLEVSMLR